MHTPSDDSISEENGRHGELRPEIILLFLGGAKNPRGTLRISVVGFAKFYTEITCTRIARTVTTGGSKEYASRGSQGGPESETATQVRYVVSGLHIHGAHHLGFRRHL